MAGARLDPDQSKSEAPRSTAAATAGRTGGQRPFQRWSARLASRPTIQVETFDHRRKAQLDRSQQISALLDLQVAARRGARIVFYEDGIVGDIRLDLAGAK